MTPISLMGKASQAIDSARLLFEAGDIDGATNRAYYAMFDAAKAALIWIGALDDSQSIKTHSGLISAFSLHFVKTDRLPPSLGKAMNRVAEIRLVADYTGDGVTTEIAQWALEQAEVFVQAVQQQISPLGQ